MKKKKILICGASGFIGRNMFETLSMRDDLEVFGIYHTRKFSENKNLIQVDLTDKLSAREALCGYDIVIQAAAITTGSKDVIERPYIHITNNLIMNALIFQAAYDNNIPHIIFFSCTTMYPVSKHIVKEEDVDLKEGIYEKYFGGGWMKFYLEKLCEFYSRLGRTKYTVIRHSNMYGPHDKYDLQKSHVFGATITKVMTAEGKVVVWGEGKEERDLLYISDLVRFVELAMKKQNENFGLFNVGLGQSISVSDLVKKIIDISGRKLTVEYDTAKPTIATKLALDTARAKERFGWEPKVNLEEGIRKTLHWYSKNIIQQ